jgi:IMP cyclohydrolase
MNLQDEIQANMAALRQNSYPGRGIVIGQTPDGSCFAQIYWIMGRSAHSRNRVFIEEGNVIRTGPFDATKIEAPSLIIYNCTRVCGRVHVVTNGNQTDTIVDALEQGGSFESALSTRTYEPDAPNYTPRISGLIDLDDSQAYRLAILKTIDNDPELPVRVFYSFENPMASVGHLISTYDGDGDPLPSFSGEPKRVAIVADIDATTDLYWNALNSDNKIAMLVKYLHIETGTCDTRIVNKHHCEFPPG